MSPKSKAKESKVPKGRKKFAEVEKEKIKEYLKEISKLYGISVKEIGLFLEKQVQGPT